MKLIEPNLKSTEKNSLSKVVNQFGKLLQPGKPTELAEDAIVVQFVRDLDNRFIMLRNFKLGDEHQALPPILIGPPGLFILNISSARGFFQAKEDSWSEMSKTTHRFGPGRPNLIKQSQDYAQQLADIFEAHDKSHPKITPVLIFADPGAHVETSNPVIRIVRMDGIDSLMNSLRQSEEVLKTNEITFLADTLEIMVNPEKALPLGEGEDFFGRDLHLTEEKPSRKPPKVALPSDLTLPPVEEKLNFSQKQWVILVVLLILTILVLVGAIIFALNYIRL